MSAEAYTVRRCTTCTAQEGERYTALRNLLLELPSGDSMLLLPQDTAYEKLYDVIAHAFDYRENTTEGMLFTGYHPAQSFFVLSLLSHLESY